MTDYYVALAEVDEILSHIESWFIGKIPSDILEVIKNNKAENIEFKYDIEKPLLEQNVKKETLELLSYINYNYWANESEKQELDQIYKENYEKLEKEKREKYNPDNLFKRASSVPKQIEELPTIVKRKSSFLTKIINKIKAIMK